MTMRRSFSLSALALLAIGCPSGDDTATGSESSSTGGESGSSSTTATTATTTADTSGGSSSGGGSSSDSGVDSSSGSTGVVNTCGDGVLDEGEECDDENTDLDDNCTAMCTIPFEITWTTTHNGSASNFDSANEVWLDPDGNAIVIGSERVTDEGANLWLAQILADGTEGWTLSYNGADGLDDFGAALAVLPDGDFVIAGSVETEMTGDDILLARIDGATQMVEWEVVVDGPGSGPGQNDEADSASDVNVDADGNIYLAGNVRVGPQNWDFFLGKYDDAGNELWTTTYDGAAGGGDFTRTVLIDGDGTAWLLGNEEQNDNSDLGLVLAYDTDGNAIDADTQTLDFRVADMAVDADGNFVVVGDGTVANTFEDIITRKYDATWSQVWEAAHDGAGSSDFARGVTVGPSGNVYTTGDAQRVNESFNGTMVAYDADGAALWGDEWNQMDADLDDSFAMAAEDAAGDVIVVGSETVLGEQSNALVRKYHPL
ncbi:MAG: hypothetical protein K1X88_08040 [Nannocystaceae bacterium]|nr:hypothetical protein [Nannocystaceae bacterium]